jgi:AraC family transcriptional regulator
VPDNFGDVLGRGLHAEHRVVLRARTLRDAESAVTEVRTDHATFERTDSLPPDDAFVVAIQLRPFPVHELWEDGRRAPITALNTGDLTVYDLKRDPRFRINNPFHSIHFHLSRTLLDAVADECGAKRVVDLDCTSSQGVEDPVVRQLAFALQPVFACPEQASRLFVDYVTRALAVHVAVKYGHMREPQLHRTGGLSPWQLRRARALLDARLDATVRIADLASACGLSASYFVQAFKKSTGMTPHRWLLRRRVEKAKALLRDRERPPADIALACGFANQSHFTRVFGAVAGCPPGEWRRRSLTYTETSYSEGVQV